MKLRMAGVLANKQKGFKSFAISIVLLLFIYFYFLGRKKIGSYLIRVISYELDSFHWCGEIVVSLVTLSHLCLLLVYGMASKRVGRFFLHHATHPLWKKVINLCLCEKVLEDDIDGAVYYLDWTLFDEETEDAYEQKLLQRQWEDKLLVLEKAKTKLGKDISSNCSSLGDDSNYLRWQLRRLELNVDSEVIAECERRVVEAKNELVLESRNNEMQKRREFIQRYYERRN